MRPLSSTPLLPCLALCFAFILPPAAHAKIHTVALGAARRVPYTPPEATPDTKAEDSHTLKIRPLVVDSQIKEWTVGDSHEITDRTFVIRRALRLNDALPGESIRWTWQPGTWISVDRVTGHVTALHLPDFDAQISDAVWFRDYAAYCGVHILTRSTSLTAIVVELGSHKPAVSQRIGPWSPKDAPHPACAPSIWQRTPIRATVRPTGLAAITFDITGTTSLVEEGEGGDEP